MVDASKPEITAVICTRNRGDRVVRAASSVLANQHSDFALIIVDQSDEDATQESLKPLLDHPSLTYVRSETRGHSVSRNLGAEHARSDLIAYTDDDCVVPEDWLTEFVDAFEVDARIGMVFGNVLPGSHDPDDGFVPAYERQEPFLAQTIADKPRVGGMGACMGVRRSVWEQLGGFDQGLGMGTRFSAGEETDLAVRSLLKGHAVYETPRVHVVHDGFRSWEQGRQLIHDYWYSTGAVFVKNFRMHPRSITPVLARIAWQWVFSRSLVAASLGESPYRLRRLRAFLRGFSAGATVPIERRKGLYFDEAGLSPGRSGS